MSQVFFGQKLRKAAIVDGLMKVASILKFLVSASWNSRGTFIEFEIMKHTHIF